MRNIALILSLLLISLNVIAADLEQDKTTTDLPIYKNAEIIDESANDEEACAKKWERYRKSQECFAPYHNVNGTMKPGAYENCAEFQYPAECPLETHD
jgi:hypothetical protein